MNRWRTLRATWAEAIGAVILLLATASALAQTAPGDYTDDTSSPSGKRGERIRQLLDAVTSGERARVEALVSDAFGGRFRDIPIQDHLDALLGLYDQSRGLDFHGVRRYTPPGPADREVVIAKNRLTGGWQGLSLNFDGTPEQRITGIQIQPARPPKGLPAPPPLTVEQARVELEQFLDRLAEAEAFSGTALLARDGQVLFEAARGIAERNHGVPMRLDSKLNLGSMDKMFTAVVIGQLVDEGTLSFQDPVAKFLGEKGWTKADLSKCGSSTCSPTPRASAPTSTTPTSGWPASCCGRWTTTSRSWPRRRWRSSRARSGGTATPAFCSRRGDRGSDGRDYFDVVRERVYAKAGMPNSDSYDIDLVVPHLAIGYSRERTPAGTRWQCEHVRARDPRRAGRRRLLDRPDLSAFAEAMRKGTLVSPATTERLWSAKPELQSPELRLRLRLRAGRPGPHRRPRRRLPGHLVRARHLPRHRLDDRGPVERGRRHAASRPEAPRGRRPHPLTAPGLYATRSALPPP